ncbi:hypothetical protein JOC70_002492 [Clostridium pascui]|uniref:DUF4358 domain-containing protein n=1 Tax=Clostridium pascui TaxID=46609 RepID=UPI001A9C68F5|nr:DUF4358 domain-containing protein [Clostridium pascui]MBM7870998.1 hypothetical protein [Clostridium pascui]
MIRNSRKSKVTLLTLLLLLIFSVGSLYGCSSKKTTKNPSVDEIVTKVKGSTDISQMPELDAEKLKMLYDIDAADLEGFKVYIAPSNIKADELAVIKVKDAKKVDEVKNKVAKRVENQGASFKDYLPEEYSLIENHVLKTQGNYVFLTISKDAEKIEAAFNESFK